MNNDNDKYEKVYETATNFVILANNVTWGLAAILLPMSLTCIGLSFKFPQYKIYLAIASIYLYFFWAYMSVYYGLKANNLRKSLIKIEENWEIPVEKSCYRTEGLVAYNKFGLLTFIILNGILIIIVSVYICCI